MIDSSAGSSNYPLPPTWKSLFGKNLLLVYNEFDLHNPLLLTRPLQAPTGTQTTDQAPLTSPPAPDRPDTATSPVPSCPVARVAPKYLFLLAPGNYVKPDMDGTATSVAQLELEARNRGHRETSQQKAERLAHQFVILACDTDDVDVAKDEWTGCWSWAMRGRINRRSERASVFHRTAPPASCMP